MELSRRIGLLEAQSSHSLSEGIKSPQAVALEAKSWREWLDAVYPAQFDTSFTRDHNDFWEWGWKFIIAMRDGQPLPDNGNAFLSLWSRNFGKSKHAEVFMSAAVCVIGKGIFLYVSGTQDLANEHLANIELLLTSDGVRSYYPEHAKPKRSSVTGANKAWAQNKIQTDGGATIQAVGLNVGVRGLRKGKDRVKGFVLDDIDDYSDSPQVALNKANTLGNSVLPTSDLEFFVIGAQNLITEHSVFNRIYTGADKMLAHRTVSGPHPAFDELETEFRDGRDIITHCVPRWAERVNREVGQRFIDTFGLLRFLAEFQHKFDQQKEGLVLKNWRDEVHVISRSQFARVFAQERIPDSWYKYAFNDWSKTKSQYHANVAGKLAISSQNSRLPGRLFLFDVMSFPAQTEPEDVAVRFLKSLTPDDTEQWDEIVGASVSRAGLERYIHNTTALIQARRDVLADVIPSLVEPLLEQQRFQTMRMSHEAKTQREIYNQVFGLPFEPMNPGADGGVDWINHYLNVIESNAHPFKPDVMGESWMYLVVEDDKYAYPTDSLPDNLHDADLARYQFSHWRYRAPVINVSGVVEHGPMKMNDDMGNGLMMLLVDNIVQSAPLTKEETRVAKLSPGLSPQEVHAHLGMPDYVELRFAQQHELAQMKIHEEREDAALAKAWSRVQGRPVTHRRYRR